MLEYKSITIDGRCDAILNAQAVEGWECFSAIPGSYDTQDRFRSGPFGVTLFFRRERNVPEDGAPTRREENSTRKSRIDRM